MHSCKPHSIVHHPGVSLCQLLAVSRHSGCRLFQTVQISPNCVFDASLVPETCLESPSLPVCFLDSIRQAKAEIRHGASCPTISMAPVLAITSLVARTAL